MVQSPGRANEAVPSPTVSSEKDQSAGRLHPSARLGPVEFRKDVMSRPWRTSAAEGFACNDTTTVSMARSDKIYLQTTVYPAFSIDRSALTDKSAMVREAPPQDTRYRTSTPSVGSRHREPLLGATTDSPERQRVHGAGADPTFQQGSNTSAIRTAHAAGLRSKAAPR